VAKRARWFWGSSLIATLTGIIGIREWNQMTKFDWLASNSAPSGCPMTITSGDFFNREGGSLYIPTDRIHNGWGQSVSIHVVGPDTKPLPDRFEVTFYSHLEDKFYRGAFPLPYDRIQEMFSKGFISYETGKREHTTYNKIIAGVAPGGAVAVWVSGVGRQYEVFFGHAKAVNLDWHQTLDMPLRFDREQERQEELQDTAASDPLVAKYIANVPISNWASYRKRYAWWPVFEGMPLPARIQRMTLFNGERDVIELPLDDATKYALRPVPRWVHFASFPPDDSGSMYEIDFDEAETMRVFEQFGSAAKPFQLVFRREHVGASWKLSLHVRNDDQSIKLLKTTIHEYLARKP
jgi:hypothetical protein